MAIVKVYFRKSAERVIRYVFGHTQPGDPADSRKLSSPMLKELLRNSKRIETFTILKRATMKCFTLSKAGTNRIAKS